MKSPVAEPKNIEFEVSWKRARLYYFLMCAPVGLTVFVSKVSLPGLAERGLGIALPLLFLATIGGLLMGAFRINAGRLTLYLILVVWACAVQLFKPEFSLSSLVFLSLLCGLYVLELRLPAVLPKAGQYAPASIFATLGYLLAMLGIIQYASQYVLGPSFAFPIEHYLPKKFLIENYNYLNLLYYGSSIYKANGVFFLEPSFFSQFLALSLLLELTGKGRIFRILVHLVALACTFSGTGLIVLGCGAIALIVIHGRWDLFVAACFAGAMVFIFADLLGLGIFADRSGEFSSTGSSGFARFVAWTYMFQDSFWGSAGRVWTGVGAGTFLESSRAARYPVAETPFAKMAYEYGLPGLLLFFGFLFHCIFSSSISAPVKVGLVVCTLMNVAYSESNTGILLSLILWPARREQAHAIKKTSSYPRVSPKLP